MRHDVLGVGPHSSAATLRCNTSWLPINHIARHFPKTRKQSRAGRVASMSRCGSDGWREAMTAIDTRASCVLLVEDEFLVSDMVAEVLAEHGFEVHAVANAKDALRHLTRGARCDLLFTDINLPG